MGKKLLILLCIFAILNQTFGCSRIYLSSDGKTPPEKYQNTIDVFLRDGDHLQLRNPQFTFQSINGYSATNQTGNPKYSTSSLNYLEIPFSKIEMAYIENDDSDSIDTAFKIIFGFISAVFVGALLLTLGLRKLLPSP